MVFLISKLFWAVAQPGNFLLFLLLLGLLCLLLTKRRRGLGLIAVAALLMASVTLLPVAQWLARPLEDRFPTLRVKPEHVDGIIFLGGAVDPTTMATRGQASLNEAAERVTETIALARRYPAARIVAAGGSGTLAGAAPAMSEADAMRQLLIEDGVVPERIIVEGKSRNTIENAQNALALAQPKPGEVWLLVTSAAHMPRAVGCFRHVGWPVLADPVDYRSDVPWMIETVQLSQNLVETETALHEWIGLVTYRLLGRIDSFFPAP